MKTPSPSSELFCEPCTFEDVLPIWCDELWPGRTSPIEPTSAMKWLGGFDSDLLRAKPSFWRIVRSRPTAPQASQSQTLGVLSGHFGGLVAGFEGLERAYRVRGVWVAPEVRRQGLTRQMMTAAFEQAKSESCTAVWIFPRQSTFPVYESFGFQRVGDWVGTGDPRAGEFGPNAYAIKRFHG